MSKDKEGFEMIKVYGSPMSSARRVYWTLEEVGLKYSKEKLNMKEKEHRSEWYLRLNPNGKVPTLVDGDFVLWESMAITWYLCDKYKPELLGNVEEKALIHQWSDWSQIYPNHHLIEMILQLMWVPESKRDMQSVERHREALMPLNRILDHHLAKRTYMVGERFTLADINVGSVMISNLALKNDLREFTALSRWMNLITDRSAYHAVKAME